jgi:hypothetical protein
LLVLYNQRGVAGKAPNSEARHRPWAAGGCPAGRCGGLGRATVESYIPGGLLVAYDWDSLIADSEAVIAGLAAAIYLYPALATVTETREFLDAYAAARGRPFSRGELQRC